MSCSHPDIVFDKKKKRLLRLIYSNALGPNNLSVQARVHSLTRKEILSLLEEGSDTGIWRRIATLLRFKHRKKPSQPDLQREIKQLINVGEEEGLLSEDEGEMIESILSFRDTLAREIMVPRPDAVIISADTPIEKLHRLVIQEGHSRFPVHDGTVDNIIGILHVKDLLVFWGEKHLDLKGSTTVISALGLTTQTSSSSRNTITPDHRCEVRSRRPSRWAPFCSWSISSPRRVSSGPRSR